MSVRVDVVCTDKDRTVEILAVFGHSVIRYDTIRCDETSDARPKRNCLLEGD